MSLGASSFLLVWLRGQACNSKGNAAYIGLVSNQSAPPCMRASMGHTPRHARTHVTSPTRARAQLLPFHTLPIPPPPPAPHTTFSIHPLGNTGKHSSLMPLLPLLRSGGSLPFPIVRVGGCRRQAHPETPVPGLYF